VIRNLDAPESAPETKQTNRTAPVGYALLQERRFREGSAATLSPARPVR
jgi:hypothetical protein